MPRYRVHLRQTVIEAAIVIVWANDAQQAEKLALEIAEKGEKPEHGKPPGLLHWVFKDTLDGIEAVSVEEF